MSFSVAASGQFSVAERDTDRQTQRQTRKLQMGENILAILVKWVTKTGSKLEQCIART